MKINKTKNDCIVFLSDDPTSGRIEINNTGIYPNVHFSKHEPINVILDYILALQESVKLYHENQNK